MSRLERTGPPSEGGVTTASKPLKITGKNIEVEGTVENKIPESDLSLTNVVHKTLTESVPGLKTFEAKTLMSVPGTEVALELKGAAPVAKGTSPGAVGPSVLKLEPSPGGETTIATTGIGGGGGALTLPTAEGGIAPNAVTSSTGGKGGKILLLPGKGGEAKGGKASGKSTGGDGGILEASGATGGPASSSEKTINKGGKGSAFIFQAGTGGGAEGSEEATNTGGDGGEASLTGGKGGPASTTTIEGKAGSGGLAKLKGGEAGAATVAGKGGAAQVVGGAATTAANSGAIELLTGTGAGTLRISISGEGLTTVKAGLTVEGAAKAEGTLEVKETLKVAGTTTLAALEGTSAVFSTTLKVKETLTAEGAATVAKTLKVTELLSAEGGLTVAGAFKSEGAATCKETLKITGLTTTSGGLTVEGTLTLPAGSIKTAAIEKENVTKEKLAKEAQEELLTVAAFPGLSAYTSAKEETETKPTFITMLVTIKGEAVLGKVKFVNDGKEVVYQWDPTITGILKQQIIFLVKKGGKWKVTLEGSVEKMEIARQVLNSV